jgi:hypothetical protein
VIHLDLKITIRNDYTRDRSFRHLTYIIRSRPALRLGHLRNFIISLSHLECLRLDLDSTHEHQCIPLFKQPPSTIKGIFGLEYTWPKLRTLSLCHFSASLESLLSLLERHSSTIKDLSLRNTSLDEDSEVMNADEWFQSEYNNAPGSGLGAEAKLSMDAVHRAWPYVLPRLRDTLRLERATLSGILGVKCHGDGWNLDQDTKLAAATEDYLIRGGQLPLDTSNCVLRTQ